VFGEPRDEALLRTRNLSGDCTWCAPQPGCCFCLCQSFQNTQDERCSLGFREGCNFSVNSGHRVGPVVRVGWYDRFVLGGALLVATTSPGCSTGCERDPHRYTVKPRSQCRSIPDGGPEQSDERGLKCVFGVGFFEQVATHAPNKGPVPAHEFGERGVVVPDVCQEFGIGSRIPGDATDECR
jgi:hypothetical protein